MMSLLKAVEEVFSKIPYARYWGPMTMVGGILSENQAKYNKIYTKYYQEQATIFELYDTYILRVNEIFKHHHRWKYLIHLRDRIFQEDDNHSLKVALEAAADSYRKDMSDSIRRLISLKKDAQSFHFIHLHYPLAATGIRLNFPKLIEETLANIPKMVIGFDADPKTGKVYNILGTDKKLARKIELERGYGLDNASYCSLVRGVVAKEVCTNMRASHSRMQEANLAAHHQDFDFVHHDREDILFENFENLHLNATSTKSMLSQFGGAIKREHEAQQQINVDRVADRDCSGDIDGTFSNACGLTKVWFLQADNQAIANRHTETPPAKTADEEYDVLKPWSLIL